jgi:hypothetical protein
VICRAQKIHEATSTARRLQAKDRASRTALDAKESILNAYLDVGVPTGDVIRRELDADAFARDIMDFLLVKLPADDNPATADSLKARASNMSHPPRRVRTAGASGMWVAAVTTLSLDNDSVDYDDDGAALVDLTGLIGLLHLLVLGMDERGFPTGLPASLRTVTTTGQSIDPSQIARLAARLPKLQADRTTSGVTEQHVAAARAAGIRLHAHEPRGGEYGEFGEFSRRRKRQAGDVVPGLMTPRNPRHPLRALRVEVPAAFVNTTAMNRPQTHT